MSLLRRRRPLAAFVAVAALLLAQGLGLSHRVAHAPHAGAPELLAHDAHSAHGFDAHHDSGSAECRLVDQAGHGDAAAAPLPEASLPAADREARRVAAFACAAGRTARAYHARGPPSFLA